MNKTIIEIKTTFGGPCVYKRAIFSDGSWSGRVQDVGQGKEQLKRELLESVVSGRDDVASFIDIVMQRNEM